MIDKILYKAKIVNNNITILSFKIIKETSNKYKFNKVGDIRGCYKEDVGVIFFLTKGESIDYIIDKLKESIQMGEEYLKKENNYLIDAKRMRQDIE